MRLWHYNGTDWITTPAMVCQGLRIRCAKVAGADVSVLLAGENENVRVNGIAVRRGIRVLRDRDEIITDRERMFFSAERAARVESFAGESVPCGRCGSAIVEGDNTVRCPACGTVSHQTENLACYTYSPTCPKCPQPSDLSAGFLWSPEDVGA